MKYSKSFLLLSSLSFVLASCGSNVDSISSEDKVRPFETDLDYTDYGDVGDADHDETLRYKNELNEVPLPDPFVLEDDGKYYIYGTTDRTGAKSFDCYETEDFNTFKLHQDIYKPSDKSFTQYALFAPEIYKFGDTFYMYYSGTKDGEVQSINVLTSTNPYGPFVEYSGEDEHGKKIDCLTEPLIKDTKSGKGLGILDQTLLVDGDDIYMYYSVYDTGIMQYIVGLKMLDPVTPDLSTYKILLRPGELTPDTTSTNILGWECLQGFKVAEGPNVIKSPINGKYYMTYSVNHYPDRYYTVCYAYSDAPLGIYTKPYEKGKNRSNIFFGYAGGKTDTVYDQWEGFMSGTAHHNIFKVGDEYMIAYHAHKNKKNSDNGRVVAFDHVYFTEDGVPYTNGPTNSLQILPESISGYENVAPKAKILTENIEKPEYINDNFVVEHYNLAWESVKEVDLGEGKSYIKLSFENKVKVGAIQIVNSSFFDSYIDNVDYISLGAGKNIIDGVFDELDYVNFEKSFIDPNSSLTFQFEDVETDKIVIGFDNANPKKINEVRVYAKTE